MGWRADRPLFRSSCQRAIASKMVGCQFLGTQKKVCLGREPFRRSVTKMGGNYAEPRAIPSLCILNWRVDRFIARSAAAPLGPATTQLHSLRALRIC